MKKFKNLYLNISDSAAKSTEERFVVNVTRLHCFESPKPKTVDPKIS
jgi:hypothetical protein